MRETQRLVVANGAIVSLAMSATQRETRWTLRTLVVASAALLLVSAAHPMFRPLAAQALPLGLGGAIEVGGEEERYLRVLQIAGMVPLTPWSIQPFTHAQTSALRAPRAANPWRARFDTAALHRPSGVVRVLRPEVRVIENTSFPFQDGGGPTWAGRGLTGEIQGGIATAWRNLSVQLAPLAFAAQNAPFTLAPNGQLGNLQFGDARYPLNIDAPQRFGSSVYARLTPGTSAITFDTRALVVGLSSQPQLWGPARDYPLVLGPNAGGFPMVYVGTGEPLNLWLFRIHARIVYGKLGESSFAAPVDTTTQRLGSGLVATILPRGLPGLELGGTRFIHQPWTGIPDTHTLLRPLSNGFNIDGLAVNEVEENQVASVFARWALPAAKAEVYGEFYREDFPGAFHRTLSLVEKPDDLAAFTIGFQRVFEANGQRIRVLRAELVNGETSHQERGARGFTQPLPPYIHTVVTQGHTLDGLILGSPEAYGGAGWRFGLDEFTPRGRRSITLERSLRFDWLPTVPVTGALVHPDVIYDIRAEVLRFGRGRDYGLTLIPAMDLNRNLVAQHDVYNILAEVTVRGW